jgi:hypothetical protein
VADYSPGILLNKNFRPSEDESQTSAVPPQFAAHFVHALSCLVLPMGNQNEYPGSAGGN